MIYNVKWAKEDLALEKHKELLEKEAKKVWKDIHDIDVREELGSADSSALKEFASIYNGRYGHKYDPEISYDASALPLFFLYGYYCAKADFEELKNK